MAEQGCLYMLTGNKHGPVLAVSVYSLRKSGYRGDIHIAVGDDLSNEVAAHIFADKRLAPVSYKRWQPPNGSGYLAKCWMNELTPFRKTLFLDADTVVVGSVEPMFDHPSPVILTQFAEWKSNGRKIPGRIKSWADIVPGDVTEMITKSHPAINTGIVRFDDSVESQRFFHEWRDLSRRRDEFIVDEKVAQLIFWRHAVVVFDSRWNCSPLYDKRKDAIIWHTHGKKHVNREQGRRVWLPFYDEAVSQRIANLQSWTPAGDRRLKAFLEERALTTAPESA